jgi:hypothetical protein
MAIRRPRFLIWSEYLTRRVRSIVGVLTIGILTVSLWPQTTSPDQSANLKPNKSTTVTISGYVRDMACLMKFNEALNPPTTVP